MRYVISIKPVKPSARLTVCHALRWGLGGQREAMSLKEAHGFVLHGGEVAHTTSDEQAMEYASAVERAGAVVEVDVL